MSAANGRAYEVDRKTGETWLLVGTQKLPHSQTEKKAQRLPYIEHIKVTGNASHRARYSDFDGKLYNGSSWKLTRVVFTLEAKEADGSVRWSRDHSKTLDLPTLQTGSFSVKLVGDTGASVSWTAIKEVYGYK